MCVSFIDAYTFISCEESFKNKDQLVFSLVSEDSLSKQPKSQLSWYLYLRKKREKGRERGAALGFIGRRYWRTTQIITAYMLGLNLIFLKKFKLRSSYLDSTFLNSFRFALPFIFSLLRNTLIFIYFTSIKFHKTKT